LAIRLKKKIYDERASLPFEGEVELISHLDNAIDYGAIGKRAEEIGHRFHRSPHQWRDIMPLISGTSPTKFIFEIPDLPTRRRIDCNAHSLASSRGVLSNTRRMTAFATCIRRIIGLYGDDPNGITDCSLGLPVEVREELSAEIEIALGGMVLDMAEGRTVKDGELDEKKSLSPSSSMPEES
jgi:hypothetical protein